MVNYYSIAATQHHRKSSTSKRVIYSLSLRLPSRLVLCPRCYIGLRLHDSFPSRRQDKDVPMLDLIHSNTCSTQGYMLQDLGRIGIGFDQQRRVKLVLAPIDSALSVFSRCMTC